MALLERLVNLVIVLLEARVPITFEKIRSEMPEAYGQANLDTAKRMFERDKDLLRDLGVPVDLQPIDLLTEEAGYRIDPKRYRLPPIDFTPEELAALLVASRGGPPDDPATVAARKLLAGADGGASAFGMGLAAPDAEVESALLLLADAVGRGRRVTFQYRTADGDAGERTVDAYGLAVRGSAWYLVGLDVARGDLRVFRLSRFGSAPIDVGEGSARPDGFRAADHVIPAAGQDVTPVAASVALSPDAAWAAEGVEGATVSARSDDGWTVVTLPTGDLGWLAGWVLSFGADAEALEPPALRAEVVRRLEAARG